MLFGYCDNYVAYLWLYYIAYESIDCHCNGYVGKMWVCGCVHHEGIMRVFIEGC
jgi:hypothetical protein